MVGVESRVLALLLLFWLAAVSASLADEEALSRPVKRVLVVYENESTLPAVMESAKGLRTGLEKRFPTRYEIYSEYLDMVRFPGADRIARLAADLTAKYAGVSGDVVMAGGPGKRVDVERGLRDVILEGKRSTLSSWRIL